MAPSVTAWTAEASEALSGETTRHNIGLSPKGDGAPYVASTATRLPGRCLPNGHGLMGSGPSEPLILPVGVGHMALDPASCSPHYYKNRLTSHSGGKGSVPLEYVLEPCIKCGAVSNIHLRHMLEWLASVLRPTNPPTTNNYYIIYYLLSLSLSTIA